MNRKRWLVLSASLSLVAEGAAIDPVRANDSIDINFEYTGTDQVFQVPAGVTSVHLVLVGGRGGRGTGANGGVGARVTGDLAVTPGQTIYVVVGGNGSDGMAMTTDPAPGGFNGGAAGGPAGGGGGGGGGGATDIRSVPSSVPGSLDSRVVVAGGGGGGGGGPEGLFNQGGSAGFAGGARLGGGGGGSAGTSEAGGSGGVAWTSLQLPTQDENGQSGVLGVGGSGGLGLGTDASGGGGGGAGYYGGGGGGGSRTNSGGGGGGGGSSHVGAVTNSSVSSAGSSDPSVVISYSLLPDSGTVSAEVTVPSTALCLELSTTSISFGTLPLGAENEPATPQITVTNCAEISEAILASGTDATGEGAFWSLVGSSETCADTLDQDRYRLALQGGSGTVGLTTSNTSLGTLTAGGEESQTALIYTACPGSSGAGTTMSMQVVFTAVEPNVEPN